MNKIIAKIDGFEVEGWYCEINGKPYIVEDEAVIEHRGEHQDEDHCWHIRPIELEFDLISD